MLVLEFVVNVDCRFGWFVEDAIISELIQKAT